MEEVLAKLRAKGEWEWTESERELGRLVAESARLLG